MMFAFSILPGVPDSACAEMTLYTMKLHRLFSGEAMD